MKQDRFLTAILTGIAIVVVLSLVVFFTRQKQPAYQPDDTPQGVLHNYVTALYQKDYEKAYAYLADLENKPKYTLFRQAFLSKQIDPTNSDLQIESAEISEREALVLISVISSWGGPFESTSRSAYTATLEKQNGQWKISNLPYPYWGWDWYQPQTDTVKPVPVD